MVLPAEQADVIRDMADSGGASGERVRPTWLERAEPAPGLGMMLLTLLLSVWALIVWVAVLVFSKS